jgi:hypothetical protein
MPAMKWMPAITNPLRVETAHWRPRAGLSISFSADERLAASESLKDLLGSSPQPKKQGLGRAGGAFVFKQPIRKPDGRAQPRRWAFAILQGRSDSLPETSWRKAHRRQPVRDWSDEEPDGRHPPQSAPRPRGGGARRQYRFDGRSPGPDRKGTFVSHCKNSSPSHICFGTIPSTAVP